MPWAGGNYTKGNNGTGGWVGDASLGIGIEAGRHDTQDSDFATGINACLNKDGSNAATANLNLGAFRYTNAGAATARTDLAQVAQVQDGDYVWLGTTGGTATAQTATATPAIAAYKAGQKFRMKIGSGLGSTTAAGAAHTLNVNSLGAKNLVNQGGTNPTAGTWVAGNILEIIYDGTNFVIMNDAGGWQVWTPVLAINTGTISNVSVATSRYRKSGQVITLIMRASWNTTSGGAYIQITGLPVNLSVFPEGSNFGGNSAWAIPVAYGGTGSVGQMFNDTATQFSIIKDQASTAWGTASGVAVFCITYQGA